MRKTINEFNSAIRRFGTSEGGSATVEFILLALPLFVPIIIFLVAVDSTSQINFEARNFSRQVARAFISSPDQVAAESKVSYLTELFAQEYSQNRGEIQPSVEVACEKSPCLSPGGWVKVTVSLAQLRTGYKATASTVETVDQWRSQ